MTESEYAVLTAEEIRREIQRLEAEGAAMWRVAILRRLLP